MEGLWDFTCSDTFALSNVSTSSGGASRLANSAEIAKLRKYVTLTTSFHFSPLCVETLGAWGSCAHLLVRRIGSLVMEQTGDNIGLHNFYSEDFILMCNVVTLLQ